MRESDDEVMKVAFSRDEFTEQRRLASLRIEGNHPCVRIQPRMTTTLKKNITVALLISKTKMNKGKLQQILKRKEETPQEVTLQVSMVDWQRHSVALFIKSKMPLKSAWNIILA